MPTRYIKFRLDSTDIWAVYCSLDREDLVHMSSNSKPTPTKDQDFTRLFNDARHELRQPLDGNITTPLYQSHEYCW